MVLRQRPNCEPNLVQFSISIESSPGVELINRSYKHLCCISDTTSQGWKFHPRLFARSGRGAVDEIIITVTVFYTPVQSPPLHLPEKGLVLQYITKTTPPSRNVRFIVFSGRNRCCISPAFTRAPRCIPNRVPYEPATSLHVEDIVFEVVDYGSEDEQAEWGGKNFVKTEEGPTPILTEATLEENDIMTLFLRDVSAKTWEAVLYWLYTGQISFTDLDGRFQKFPDDLASSNSRPCSSKSVYRVAVALELEPLRLLAFSAIQQQINKHNVLDELFTNFAASHDEIMRMEIGILVKHWKVMQDTPKFLQKMKDIAEGKYHFGARIMAEMMKRLAACRASAIIFSIDRFYETAGATERSENSFRCLGCFFGLFETARIEPIPAMSGSSGSIPLDTVSSTLSIDFRLCKLKSKLLKLSPIEKTATFGPGFYFEIRSAVDRKWKAGHGGPTYTMGLYLMQIPGCELYSVLLRGTILSLVGKELETVRFKTYRVLTSKGLGFLSFIDMDLYKNHPEVNADNAVDYNSRLDAPGMDPPVCLYASTKIFSDYSVELGAALDHGFPALNGILVSGEDEFLEGEASPTNDIVVEDSDFEYEISDEAFEDAEMNDEPSTAKNPAEEHPSTDGQIVDEDKPEDKHDGEKEIQDKNSNVIVIDDEHDGDKQDADEALEQEKDSNPEGQASDAPANSNDPKKTNWEAILYWLYTGQITFAPLDNAGSKERENFIKSYQAEYPDRPAPCSPRSVYRIATTLRSSLSDSLPGVTWYNWLPRLSYWTNFSRDSQQSQSGQNLSECLHSHAEISRMMLVVFAQNWETIQNSPEFAEKINGIAKGDLPYAGPLMNELMKRMTIVQERA
ncbi:hypothetical protein K474DRAFT_1672132 [Panus rudis PR-1116 ss-1]|nr:hypothetical protein K474DRAFT_1672132 [Panus rudis PR-1116 ss-1]